MKKGFTLIEVLIVIIIIGILATIALPQFTKLVEKTRKAEALTNLAAIYTAEMVYYTETEAYLGPLADIVAINDSNLNMGLTGRYFTYSVLSTTGARASRTVGSAHYIEQQFSDGKIRGSASNPWGVSTNFE